MIYMQTLMLVAAVFLAQLAEGFFLDLADALAGEAEALADLFQGQRVLPADARFSPE